MIRLQQVRFFSKRFPLCRPFRFGIVELTELEHLVVVADFEIDSRTVHGFAGENLAPRWFVKDVSRSIDAELAYMKAAIRTVADAAIQLPAAPSPFDLWWQLHQHVRAGRLIDPPLLAQLAESLVERAAIDAWGRYHNADLARLIREDSLGFTPEAVHPSLKKTLLPIPAATLAVRHTVGLADPIENLSGLLHENGIRRLKVKLGGDPDADAERIHAISRACESADLSISRVTLDGNENYNTVAAFELLIDRLHHDRASGMPLSRIAWIEQPFHRNIALGEEIGEMFTRLRCPPMIIDESDASPADLPRALELGYAGTTHKNCKGVFKSMLHAAILREHSTRTGRSTLFSGEDLTIVAPWSMAGDLIVAAAVGVLDIERNGHHYTDGLSGFGSAVSEQAPASYPSLYRRREDGTVALRIVDGAVEIQSTSFEPPVLDDFIEIRV